MRSRPIVGILFGSLAPYNQNLMRRLHTELDAVDWRVLVCGDPGPWDRELPPSLRLEVLADGFPPAGWNEMHVGAWFAAQGAFRKWKSEGVSAAIVSGYASPFRYRFLQLCQRALPTLIRADSNILGERNASAVKKLLKRLIVTPRVRRCAGALVMGEVGRQFFQKYGIPPSRMFLSPIEPDFPYFDEVPLGDLETFRLREGLPADRRYLMCCNRLVRAKRVDVILRAFERVASEYPTWDVIVVGDGPLRAELQQSVPPALRPRVHWLGFRQRHDLRCAYHSAEVFLLASEYEPFASVVCEAAAAGLVVVASDVVQAARELVRPGCNGELFRCNDPLDLESCLRRVLDPNKRRGYQAAIHPCLEAYRRSADPVRGIAMGLAYVQALRSHQIPRHPPSPLRDRWQPARPETPSFERLRHVG